MVEASQNKKIPLLQILSEALAYCNHNPKMVSLFVVLNYLICAVAFYSWKTIWFWPALVVMYVLWSAFFRFYFARKPYLMLKPMLASMVPSTKIVVLTVLVVSLIILLPLVPLFLKVSPEFYERYAGFLQNNLQDGEMLDMVANLVVVVFSPLIFYRPMLAWIATLIGRSGSLKFAWGKTEGNYWEFLLLAIIIDLSIGFIYKGVLLLGGNVYVALIPLSVLAVYFNLILARLYSFFFLE